MSIVPLEEAQDRTKYGGKAVNLGAMLRAKLPVPSGFAISIDAFTEDKLKSEATQKLNDLLDERKLYAVRSSATIEDAKDESWAGQFETFLNVEQQQVTAKIEACHNSSKDRARTYSQNHKKFNVSVVVQEMLNPEYAGVLFTEDPVTGEDGFVIEYVEGLGETLVSGKADPTRIVLGVNDQQAPFNINELSELAKQVLDLFGTPQDIEWAWADHKIWLVQARPITTTGKNLLDHYLGEPEELFYWGPSRAEPLYMSDFIEAADTFFIMASTNPIMPSPPKTIVLFYKAKMVWLNNAQAFSDFTEATFEAYAKRDKLDEDIKNWQNAAKDTNNLINTWQYTLFAEFSLYGAESALTKKLQRFDDKTRQEIWANFSLPDSATFLTRIDEELLESDNPKELAKKYPWIQDGYQGLADGAEQYFIERLKILKQNPKTINPRKNREKMAKDLDLTDEEVKALNLARGIAEFMDQRKAWMMQTRRSIKEQPIKFGHGWLFDDGISSVIQAGVAEELWERYVDFKTSDTTVKGIVASNGGKDFIHGEVLVISSPTDAVAADKILVVPSTSPSYVPLMRKARALITDHGGMMSHAAIIAREFGLPCIVGTKQATKILKDGDKVVLNLIKGEVIR